MGVLPAIVILRDTIEPTSACFCVRLMGAHHKRVASTFGDDIEDIDEENAIDQQRAKRLVLGYDVYGALEEVHFNPILQSTLVEDELEKLDGSGAADPGRSCLLDDSKIRLQRLKYSRIIP